MDAIFAAERVIWGRNANERLALRQVHVAPLVADLERFPASAIWPPVAQRRSGQGDQLHAVTLG